MRAKFVIIIVAALLFNNAWASEGKVAVKERKNVWAGKFYPGTKKALEDSIKQYIDQAKEGKKEGLRAVIMPHAGYIYSGPTAGYCARLLIDQKYEKVIIIGPDHRIGFSGASVSEADYYLTPMGRVPLHEDTKKIIREPSFQYVRQSDEIEHSVEVEIPFLQYTLKDFEIIPIVMGFADEKKIADILLNYINDRTLLVISSDLSHYLDYASAKKKDSETISYITGFEFDKLKSSENSACGKSGILILMHLAKKLGWKPVLLHYANSGDTAGDKGRVVGYAAFAYYRDTPGNLSSRDGEYLLSIARKAIEEDVLHGKEMKMDSSHLPEKLQEKVGAFVTITIDGKLRGCIGNIIPRLPLWESVKNNALSAASRDPRFPSLSKPEVDKIHLEISVLTASRPLPYSDGKDLIKKLRPGIDGVIIRKGFHQATFLPQVWSQVPNKKEFMAHLCRKAGLSPRFWEDEKLEVSTYQVQAFEEKR